MIKIIKLEWNIVSQRFRITYYFEIWTL